MELIPGTLLQGGEFKILKKLGQGGFGITYLAYQQSLNRDVAIKEFFMKDCCQRDKDSTIVTIPTESNHEFVEKYKEKFKREAQFTAGLLHPNIVTIYSIFEENATIYYVMEYLSGGSLSDYIRGKKLSEDEALIYVRQIADALELMHSNHETHLDVKPGNIMLRGKNDAVLIDFGLTKVYDETGNAMTTTSSVATYTPHYAPIEQYKGIKGFSPETDIYALGATLYRLVVGELPPEADDILQDGLPKLPDCVSQSVKTAIKAAMQPRKSDRPKSIKEFINLLANCESCSLGTEENNAKNNSVKFQLNENAGFNRENNKSLETTVGANVNPQISDIKDKAESVVESSLDEKKNFSSNDKNNLSSKKSWKYWMLFAIGIFIAIISTIVIIYLSSNKEKYVVELPHEDTSVEVIEPQKEEGVLNGHKWVDLGLSVNWATCNVGANSPEDYGDFFAWGEIHKKYDYGYDNYETPKSLSIDIAGSNKYDVARVKWGNDWRLPTRKEFEELIYRCNWTEVILDNGNKAFKVIGPNNNFMYLPIGDMIEFYDEWVNNDKFSCCYWSSTPLLDYSNYGAYYLNYSKNYSAVVYGDRYHGLPVRPVCEK